MSIQEILRLLNLKFDVINEHIQAMKRELPIEVEKAQNRFRELENYEFNSIVIYSVQDGLLKGLQDLQRTMADIQAQLNAVWPDLLVIIAALQKITELSPGKLFIFDGIEFINQIKPHLRKHPAYKPVLKEGEDVGVDYLSRKDAEEIFKCSTIFIHLEDGVEDTLQCENRLKELRKILEAEINEVASTLGEAENAFIEEKLRIIQERGRRVEYAYSYAEYFQQVQRVNRYLNHLSADDKAAFPEPFSETEFNELISLSLCDILPATRYSRCFEYLPDALVKDLRLEDLAFIAHGYVELDDRFRKVLRAALLGYPDSRLSDILLMKNFKAMADGIIDDSVLLSFEYPYLHAALTIRSCKLHGIARGESLEAVGVTTGEASAATVSVGFFRGEGGGAAAQEQKDDESIAAPSPGISIP